MQLPTWDKIKMAWALIQAPGEVEEVSPVPEESDISDNPRGANPYLDDTTADWVYDTLENGLHAIWPLLRASEYAGTLAARGVVWGVLYSFTSDETREDQKGIAWELGSLVRDYLPEDQDPAQMAGVLVEGEDAGGLFERLTSTETRPGIFEVRGEILAFMDAAISGNFEASANVTDAVRRRLGAVSYSGGNQESLEEGEKVMAINFLGSCLASAADKYSELKIARADGPE